MKASRFRKKPVVIEAVRWMPSENGRLPGGWPKDWGQDPPNWQVGLIDLRLFIPTLEGEMYALPGDWIIRGVKGEFYPCKPDIFETTYEAAS